MVITQDNEDFLQHYQLSFDPFAEHGQKFQFFKARRRAVLEQLIHFARYGNFLLLVTGPMGSGKTVLRHAMVAAGKDTAVNVVVSAAQAQEAGSLMQYIGNSLGCGSQDVMGLLKEIEQLSISGSDVHILIDDAHALRESAILLLSKLAKGNGVARASVFLFGEPALQSLLEDASVDDEEIEHHLIELEPWSASDMRSYLQARLEAAGQGVDLFTVQELDRLYHESGGWPGEINQLAGEILRQRVNRKAKKNTAVNIPYKIILPVILLLILAFALVYFLYQQDEAVEESVPLVNFASQEEQRVMVATPRAEDVERLAIDLTPEPVVELAAEPELQVEQAIPEPVKPMVVPTIPKPEQEEAVAEIKAEATTLAQEAKPAANKPPVKLPEAAPPKPQAKAPVKPAAVAPAVSIKVEDIGKAAWYAAQPKQNYTLQVFASANEETARKFIASRSGPYNYFRKKHQNKALFVVTYGNFNTHKQAVAAERSLPASIRKDKPWIRNFAAIQQELW